MKLRSLVFIALFTLVPAVFGQDTQLTPTPKPSPPPVQKYSEIAIKNLEKFKQSGSVITREQREQAYAKLLEGQRHQWNSNRQRQQLGVNTVSRPARLAFQKAVEYDPTLVEGYVALAELIWTTDLDEAVALLNIAAGLDADSFGAHHLLAWIYTIKSGLKDNQLNTENSEKAVKEWKEIARLDPRNAEAFAFLSEFYARTGKQNERIEALKRWLASNEPLNPRFYQAIIGNHETLQPESASLKLGSALLEAGRTAEAIEYLNRAIADDPENTEAIDLLSEAIESADPKDAATALDALQQAAYANPDNVVLLAMMAQIQARNGKIEDAAKVLKNAIAKNQEKDKYTAASLQVVLGDVYANAERFDEAIAAYQNSFTIRGIEKNTAIATDEDINFAVIVIEKMTQAYKNANRPNDARSLLEQSRLLFGKEDSFIDRQMIQLLRESGKKDEALKLIRGSRLLNPEDYNLLRLEATVLTESGKVDEAVALIKTLMAKKTSAQASIMYDDFTNLLFISSLYSEAKRGKEGIEAANQAFAIAKSEEQKQIAKLTLATAQQMSGDFKSAEQTLRDLLKQSPRNPIALNNLGYFLLERDVKIQEAFDLIQQAVRIDPNNSSYLDSLGWAYYKLGKFAEAEKYLKNAVKLDSTSATIYEHLGDVYQKQNKIDMAKIAWQKALNLASETEMIDRIKVKLSK